MVTHDHHPRRKRRARRSPDGRADHRRARRSAPAWRRRPCACGSPVTASRGRAAATAATAATTSATSSWCDRCFGAATPAAPRGGHRRGGARPGRMDRPRAPVCVCRAAAAPPAPPAAAAARSRRCSRCRGRSRTSAAPAPSGRSSSAPSRRSATSAPPRSAGPSWPGSPARPWSSPSSAGPAEPVGPARRSCTCPTDAPMRREWAVVCDAPDYPALLTAWELPGQSGVPRPAARSSRPSGRVEPQAVRDAARACAQVALQLGHPEARLRCSTSSPRTRRLRRWSCGRDVAAQPRRRVRRPGRLTPARASCNRGCMAAWTAYRSRAALTWHARAGHRRVVRGSRAPLCVKQPVVEGVVGRPGCDGRRWWRCVVSGCGGLPWRSCVRRSCAGSDRVGRRAGTGQG